MPRLERLFEPITINGLGLKNRIIMPAMVTNYATEDGEVTQRLIDYHVARAAGGVALIELEASYVRPDGKGFVNQVGVHRDSLIPGLKHLVDEVHLAGAKMSIQLYHAGRETTSEVTGIQPVAPSPIPCPAMRQMPRELGVDEVHSLADDFATAARRAQEAGFDAVEIHGAHGYLIAEFLSPFSNKRIDEYGGSIQGRARFALEVVRKVRQVVGAGYPILFLISAAEFVDGGLTVDQSKVVCRLLVEEGVDALHVSAGNYATPGGLTVAPMDTERALLVPLAAAIKRAVSVPVVAVDRLHDPIVAEQVLVENQADLVAIGRGLLTDASLPAKAERGELEDIAPCICCNQSCLSNLNRQRPISCLVNPACGREREFALQSAEKPKQVVVVGGGVAGLEAARVLAQRGHHVTLLEERGRLGGEFLVASIAPRKEEIGEALAWMIRQVYKAGVQVELNLPATPEAVLSYQPDTVLIATGARPIFPEVPGLNRDGTVFARDVLLGNVMVGEKVLVAGGSAVGAEVAEFLAAQRKKVTVIEATSTIAAEVSAERRYWLMRTLREGGVDLLTNTALKELSASAVIVQRDGQQESLGPFDNIVLALGYLANDKLYQQLRDRAPELLIIGDAVKARSAAEAIYEAAKTARAI